MGPFVRDVVVQVSVDLVDPALGDRSGQLPRVEPHPPCHQLGHALRCHAGSEATRGERPMGLRARACSAAWAPCLVSSYSRRRGRPSAAAASSHREVSRPNSSSRLKALYRVPWPVKERDPLCSRMVWARPNPWKVACPERSIDSATSRISVSRGSRVPGLRRGIDPTIGRYLPYCQVASGQTRGWNMTALLPALRRLPPNLQ